MNLKHFFCIFIFLITCTFSQIFPRTIPPTEISRQVEVVAKQIVFPDLPNAYNPSLIYTNHGLLLVFRYIPEQTNLAHSVICAVFLDSNLEPIGQPQILNTRVVDIPTPSYAEDARLFMFQGEPYIIYNDNTDVRGNEPPINRTMFIAKLNFENGSFWLDRPLKLYHERNHRTQFIEKNWSPFQWNDHLLLSYTLSPHEVLRVNLNTGCCTPVYLTESKFLWNWGRLRGGAAAERFGDEYFAFFHCRTHFESNVSQFNRIPHYIGGAYTFSVEPPFELKRITPCPLINEAFYAKNKNWIRIFYPAGFARMGNDIYLAYGIDDKEMWIAKMQWQDLNDQLVPIELADNINSQSPTQMVGQSQSR